MCIIMAVSGCQWRISPEWGRKIDMLLEPTCQFGLIPRALDSGTAEVCALSLPEELWLTRMRG